MASRTVSQVCLILLLVFTIRVKAARDVEPNYLLNVADAPSPMEREQTAPLPQRRINAKTPTVAIDESKELEQFTERYSNRTNKIKRQVIQDDDYNYVNHGTWTQWNPDVQKAATGTYQNDKRHGKWTRWYCVVDIKNMKVSIEK